MNEDAEVVAAETVEAPKVTKARKVRTDIPAEPEEVRLHLSEGTRYVAS
jgi:hypothetical protein